MIYTFVNSTVLRPFLDRNGSIHQGLRLYLSVTGRIRSKEVRTFLYHASLSPEVKALTSVIISATHQLLLNHLQRISPRISRIFVEPMKRISPRISRIFVEPMKRMSRRISSTTSRSYPRISTTNLANILEFIVWPVLSPLETVLGFEQ
jgi:hypothetical protein